MKMTLSTTKPAKLTEAILEEAIAERMNITKAEANRFINTFKNVLLEEVPASGGFQLGGVLVANIKQREARMGRNPKTGEAVQIPAKRVLSIKPGKRLADALN